MYLLDTNIISDIARNPDGAAANRFAQTPADELCTSIVVSAEVLFGLARGAGHRMRDAMHAVLDSLPILSLEPPVDEIYANVRATMAEQGKAITPNDMFIAAHALALQATMVTADQGFRLVPGLQVENWMKP